MILDQKYKNYELLVKIVNFQLGREMRQVELEELSILINNSKALAQVAEVHGVAPFVYQLINNQQLKIDPELKRQFQSLMLRHSHAAQVRARVLLEVIEAFDIDLVQSVLLKGAALANMIYSSPEFRPMRDMDILVSKSQQLDIRRILERLSFVFDESHASIYMGDIHHLPNAIKQVDGLNISLEVHHQVYSRDVEDSQNFEQVIGNTQVIKINETSNALALDHISMLNHICRHAFSLAPEVRLIHQYDILRYAEKYFEEIPWQKLKQENHFIINTLQCLQYSLYIPEKLKPLIGEPKLKEIKGVGEAMLPYTHILSKKKNIFERLSALFSPSPWWMHVNYNIAPEKSLIWCYLFIHPKKVIKNITMRLFYATKNSLWKTT